jgi:DNA-3-methyladenine glycosylase
VTVALRAVPRDHLDVPAPEAAVTLLGTLLVRVVPTGERLVARIVEAEAYERDDPASHSVRGRSASNAAMFAAPGTAYVYRSYGVHWCLNVSTGPEGHGAAVLVRAAAVRTGIEVVRANRPTARSDRDLLRGPGRLTLGLDVDAPRHDRTDLLDVSGELSLVLDPAGPPPASEVRAGPRVGVTQAADVPWRFHLDVPEVSPYRRSPRAPRPAVADRRGPRSG